MQYMLMNLVPTERYANMEKPADHPDGPVWGAYTKSLADAGVLRGGSALRPAHTSTTVRVRNGSREVQDGPFADSKEQLGGFFLIDVPDLDAALDWAAKNPAASFGAVEVRPVA